MLTYGMSLFEQTKDGRNFVGVGSNDYGQDLQGRKGSDKHCRIGSSRDSAHDFGEKILQTEV